jgi:hypothetical protein
MLIDQDWNFSQKNSMFESTCSTNGYGIREIKRRSKRQHPERRLSGCDINSCFPIASIVYW